MYLEIPHNAKSKTNGLIQQDSILREPASPTFGWKTREPDSGWSVCPSAGPSWGSQCHARPAPADGQEMPRLGTGNCSTERRVEGRPNNHVDFQQQQYQFSSKTNTNCLSFRIECSPNNLQFWLGRQSITEGLELQQYGDAPVIFGPREAEM